MCLVLAAPLVDPQMAYSVRCGCSVFMAMALLFQFRFFAMDSYHVSDFGLNDRILDYIRYSSGYNIDRPCPQLVLSMFSQSVIEPG